MAGYDENQYMWVGSGYTMVMVIVERKEAMSSIRDALLREQSAIENNISRLDDRLGDYPENADCTEGLCAIRRIQRSHLAMVEDLLAIPGPPEEVLGYVHTQLLMAQRRHSLTHVDHDGHNSDVWWDSLQEADYLAHLIMKLEESQNGHHDNGQTPL